MLAASFEADPFTIFWNEFCYQHKCHLIHKKAMVLTDLFLKHVFEKNFKYFASITKIIQVWRESFKKILAAWERRWGSTSAATHARSQPARCCGGRWGSTSNSESRIAAPGRRLLTPVFEDVLFALIPVDAAVDGLEPLMDIDPGEPRQRPADGGDAVGGARGAVNVNDNDGANPDEISLDAQDAHRRTMGKWRVQTLEALRDEVFWYVLSLSRIARQPLDHLSNILMKKTPEFPFAGLAKLVFSEAGRVEADFDNALTGGAMEDVLSSCQTDALGSDLNRYFVTVPLHNASAFHRRIAARTSSSRA